MLHVDSIHRIAVERLAIERVASTGAGRAQKRTVQRYYDQEDRWRTIQGTAYQRHPTRQRDKPASAATTQIDRLSAERVQSTSQLPYPRCRARSSFFDPKRIEAYGYDEGSP
ncbi:MAG: hypothetical protein JOZ19_00480 [Rubrobacter sp.]|nr:hypothetical protein [Rubrobacter sp.]